MSKLLVLLSIIKLYARINVFRFVFTKWNAPFCRGLTQAGWFFSYKQLLICSIYRISFIIACLEVTFFTCFQGFFPSGIILLLQMINSRRSGSKTFWEGPLVSNFNKNELPTSVFSGIWETCQISHFEQ